jgi:hypothetical protein
MRGEDGGWLCLLLLFPPTPCGPRQPAQRACRY